MMNPFAMSVGNEFTLTLHELSNKSKHLVRIKDIGHPKTLLLDAENAFNAAKVLAPLAKEAGILLSNLDEKLDEIYKNLYEVCYTVEYRRHTQRKVWQKILNFLKGAMEFLANLHDLAPVAVASTMFIVPHLTHLVRF